MSNKWLPNNIVDPQREHWVDNCVILYQINCEDDRGVLRGNWSGDFKNGVPPSKWTGSAAIMRQWAKSKFSPVMYGQCWVFAAVMCTGNEYVGNVCIVKCFINAY